MNLLLRYYRCVHLLVCLGVLAYSVAEENLVYAIIAVPVVMAAYLIVGGPRGRPLPRWVVNLALLAATLLMAMNWAEPLGNTISVLCSYLVWLQLIKLFEPRNPRDQAQIILLSLMLAVGACLTSVTPEMGAVLVVYLPVLLVTVMLYQVYAAQASAASNEPVPAAIPDRPRSAGWSSALMRFVIGDRSITTHQRLPSVAHSGLRGRSNLSRTGMLAAMIIAALAPMVYVTIPRGLGEDFFGPWQPANTPAITGFRDHVQLGAQGIITESQRIVMKVKVESTDRLVIPTARTYRLRGAVLDRYDPDMGMWRRSSHVSSTDRRFAVAGGDSPRPTNPRGPFLLVNVTLLDQPVNHLFTIWKPLWITWETGVRRQSYISNHFDGQAEIARRVRGMSYTAVCAPGELSPPGPVPFVGFTNPPFVGESVRVNERGEPFPEPPEAQFQSGPIHELAQRVLGEARIVHSPDDWHYPRRAVGAFVRHLQSNYVYTTRMTAPAPGGDPIEMFLFDEERGGRFRGGHCEYFASALAAMSLAAGVPARVVTGYVASEYDPVSETYTVRENQAHAWVEAEVRPGLWEEFDPSPSADISRLHNPQGTIAAAFRKFIDAMQFAWIEGVVTFNRERQVGAFQEFSLKPLGALRAFNKRLADMLANEQEIAQENRAVYWTRLAGWAVLAATALLLVGHIVVSRGVRLVSRLVAGGSPRADPLSLDPRMIELMRLYQRMLQSLARAGIAKPAHRPGLAHLLSLRGDRPSLVEPAMRVADLYYRARFAGERVRREDVLAAEGSLRAVEAAARGRG